ncbi:MAG: tetratricopeptide repeat protein, partial [Alphaproteobacteria bacterium]|nr:tetratricopeptide repeat protein [Alphaproteobacteria bacterium]
HAYYATGKYEQAIAALKDSLARNPEAMGCNTLLAVIYGELGRTEEANKLVADVLRISPRATVSHMRERLPIKDPALAERYFEGLSKAGLPA